MIWSLSEFNALDNALKNSAVLENSGCVLISLGGFEVEYVSVKALRRDLKVIRKDLQDRLHRFAKVIRFHFPEYAEANLMHAVVSQALIDLVSPSIEIRRSAKHIYLETSCMQSRAGLVRYGFEKC